MKFQRTDLIKRVQAEIGRRILAAEEANTKARTKAAKERQDYLDLLEAATDDEVTTSSLERMGFRTAQLFRR